MGLHHKGGGDFICFKYIFYDEFDIIAVQLIDSEIFHIFPYRQICPVQILIKYFQQQGFFIFKIGIKAADGYAGF